MILRPGTFLLNRYEIIEKIGSGGMSEVYKARCHTLERFVAIKILKSEFADNERFVKRFKIEAQSVARLEDDNIVRVYDVVDDGRLHFIVMELIDGITLKTYIARKGRLDSKETIALSLQVAYGIKAAHKRGIIHRDIKPQNIIISKNADIKVADFGIAGAAYSEPFNMAIGSVYYISPEQAKGGGTDERSDIYSLGVTMYEMVCGRPPFEGSTAVSVALAHVENIPVPPRVKYPDINEGLERIILRCMQKKPERRYADIDELIAELKRIIAPVKVREAAKASPNGDTMMFKPVSSVRPAQGRGNIKAAPNKNANKETILNQQEEERTGFDKAMTVAGIIIAFILVFVLVFIFIIISGILDKKNKRIDLTSSNPVINSSSQADEALVSVPYITGMNQELAQERLKELSLQLKVKESIYNDTVEKGYIISQNPAANEKLEKYSNVEVIVSLGSDKVNVKQIGIDKMSAENAKNVLENLGLKVNIVEQFSDNIERGMLIRYEPDMVAKGGTVTLYSSKGREIRQTKVPKLVGKTEAEAQKLLKGSKLSVGEVKSEYNDTVPKGSVISQSADEDTVLNEWSKIDYVLSLGAKPQPQTEPTAVTTAAPKNYKYLASIDATYNLSDLIGPGSAATSITIMIRLRQTVNGQVIYTTLMEPRKVTGDTLLPVRFKNIEGAYGVEQGAVEVVETDNNNVLKSYSVEFFKVE